MSRRTSRPNRRRIIAGVGALSVVGTSLALPMAHASTPMSASFAGGSKTVTVGSTVYAKNNGELTLHITTSADTRCVVVSGAHSGLLYSETAKSTWSLGGLSASTGDGVQGVTAAASPDFVPVRNPKGNIVGASECTGASRSTQASYVLDNTAPVLTPNSSPLPNSAGWSKADTTVTWTATDAGVGAVQPTTSTTVSTNGSHTVEGPKDHADRLGNIAAGRESTTVKLDKTVPTITATRTPAEPTSGWNNTDVTVSFTGSDPAHVVDKTTIPGSGVKSTTGPVTLSTSGANQSVTGSVVDNADNTASTTVGRINIDKDDPTLTGAPTTAAVDGWHNSDVTIKWTASDELSGLASATPADVAITGEGRGLTAGALISDRAGNTTYARSQAVNIDRTAPKTGVTGTSNAWNKGDVTLTLAPSDNLSGIAYTSYSVNGGTLQRGTSLTLSEDGEHTVSFFSTDVAGNVEKPSVVQVKIDQTAPTLRHIFTPSDYTADAWTNEDVTVTFVAGDEGGSGVADVTAPVIVRTEGTSQKVVGTVIDAAGNRATDTALVSIDKTKPEVSGAADRDPNRHGWYKDEVTVGFRATDDRSGISAGPASVTLGEGKNQQATGVAIDAAGNRGTATVTGIDVDTTAPTLTGSASTTEWSNGDVTVTWSASDDLSGLDGDAPEPSTVTGEGDALSVSTTVRDKAGNQTSRTVGGIKIDRTAPDTTAELPEPHESGFYQGSVEITLNAHDPMSGVAKPGSTAPV